MGVEEDLGSNPSATSNLFVPVARLCEGESVFRGLRRNQVSRLTVCRPMWIVCPMGMGILYPPVCYSPVASILICCWPHNFQSPTTNMHVVTCSFPLALLTMSIPLTSLPNHKQLKLQHTLSWKIRTTSD